MSIEEIVPLVALPTLILGWFVLVWAVYRVAGKLIGWTAIAKVYPCHEPLPKTKRWDYCSIPNLMMRNCVRVALDEKGMYFDLWFLFKLGNPAIFVPWSDISVSSSKMLFFDMVKLSLKKIPKGSFQFYKGTADKFIFAAGSQWPSS